MSVKIEPPRIEQPARLLLAREVIDELRRQRWESGFAAVDLTVTLNFLAEHVHISQLRDGQRLIDAMDFKAWLRELAEEASK
jgi:hypothetical protein